MTNTIDENTDYRSPEGCFALLISMLIVIVAVILILVL